MRFHEAMKHLEEGKKVRCKHWTGHTYITQKGYDDGHCLSLLDWETVIKMEWELYEEPEQLYTFAKAVEHLAEGGKVRRKSWHPDARIRVDDEGDLISNFQGPTLDIDDLEAKDWVLV